MTLPNRVCLFVPCLVDSLYPNVALAVEKVFHRLGVEVDYPSDQICCGQFAVNAGQWDEARRLARKTLDVFAGKGPIVGPSASCLYTIKALYQDLFEPGTRYHRRAASMSKQVYDFSEFLVSVLHVSDVGAEFAGTVTYHHSCHLNRYLGVKDDPVILISNIRGVTYIPMHDFEACCGFGGTFSVKYPHISQAILDDKLKNIARTGADYVVTAEPGCLMHLQLGLKKAGLPQRACHLAELLASPDLIIS
ncbi:MAG: (Fe-S)-binding protein [Deltaproteobacteria bacterium]|nr:(Fe-S)-binding protein [Deltaproteobacteria bacterium]